MSLRPTRALTALFVGTFLVGGAVGALLDTVFQDMTLTDFLQRTSDPAAMAARINQKYQDQYHLTPEEQKKIQPLTADMAKHLYNVRRRFGVDVISTLDDYHRRIGAQMTPDHQAAYQKANAIRRQRMTQMLLLDPPPAPADSSP